MTQPPPMPAYPPQPHPLVAPIGELLAAAVPAGWRRLHVEYRAVGLHIETDVMAVGFDGVARPVQPPATVVQLLGWLRAGMYQPGRGTWFGATLVVDPGVPPQLTVGLDEEPRWRWMPSPQGFQDELRFFPRSEQYIPDWLRARAGLPPTAHPAPGLPPVAPAGMPPTGPVTTTGSFAVPATPAVPPAAPAVSPPVPGAPATPAAVPGVPPPAPGVPTVTARGVASVPPPSTPPVSPAPPVSPSGSPGPSTGDGKLRMARVYDRLDDAGRPVADRAPVPSTERDQVLDYLTKAPAVLAARGYVRDEFDPERQPGVPMTFHTDGTWVWGGAVAYYLREYDLPPDPDLLAHIRANNYTLPEVDEETRKRAIDLVTNG